MVIMLMSNLLITIAGASVVWHVVTSILIYDALQKRKIEVSFLWLRLMIPKYARQYKQITMQETGVVGPLFYHWIVSINMALAAIIAAILLSLLG